MGDLKAGEAMKAANNRFNQRRATKKRAKLLQEAEQRQIVADRELHLRLKAECQARNPQWFGGVDVA